MSTADTSHKVYSIPSNTSFLGGVADILCGRGIPLEDWCVYVPTRQSGFDLSTLLCERQPKQVTLLPRIYSLGDVDPEELSLKGALTHLPYPPLRRMRRQLLMAELLSKFCYQGSVLDLPQRLDLGAHLLSLVDTLQLQGLSAKTLTKVDMTLQGAEHWETIQKFLGLLGRHWDAIVKDAKGTDPLVWQKDMMAAHGATLSTKQNVMVAGSVGTVAATVQFMKMVQALPRGVLVLPGLLPGKDTEDLSPKDPQYALYRLLSALNITSENVAMLPSPPSLNYASMMDEKNIDEPCFDQPLNVSFMVAPDSRSEGEMVALGVRKAMAEGARRVLCISPQDDLCSHIIHALQPFGYDGVTPNDSHLMAHEMGRFLHSLSLWFSNDTLLDGLRATFTHPYAKNHHASWQAFDRQIVRGTDGIFCWNRFRALLETHIKKNPESASLDDFFTDLYHHAASVKSQMSMAQVVNHMGEMITWICGTDLSVTDWFDHLCGIDAEAFQSLWVDLSTSTNQGLIDVSEVPTLMKLFLDMEKKKLSSKRGDIFILSPAEARFMEADVVFLGGLNAGIWPSDGAINPFLTRKLERELSLLPHDYYHGQSAHDFIQHLHHKKVVLSYAQKIKGAPGLPSELLSYLKGFLEKRGYALGRNKEIEDVWLAGRKAGQKPQAISPPQPRAELKDKPTRFSVSDVMSLQSNPYDFYAKHILGLRPLPSPHDDSARQFGIFMHHCLEVALKSAKTRDEAIERAFLRSFGAPTDFPFLWGKVNMMVAWVLAQTDGTKDRLLEAWGTFTFILKGQMLTLFAKADRIDVHEGMATLIDYKTGQIPPQSGIKRGTYPQLALEGLILMKGQFDHLPPRLALISMEHWKIPPIKDGGVIEPVSCDVSLLIKETEVGLLSLLSYFQEDGTIYRAHPWGRQKISDYDHLARTDEWYGGGL